MYFNKPELGKTLPAQTKPDHITNENFTFGSPTKKISGVYELIMPKKKLSEINREYTDFHDKKIISHGHYFPAERINRHYKSPPFDENQLFGELKKSEVTVHKCLEQNHGIVVINKWQKEFLERSQGALGKKFKNLSCKIDEDMRMGIKLPFSCSAKAVIEQIDPCDKNIEIFDALIHLNKIRRQIFVRYDLHINDLLIVLRRHDKLNIGHLPLADIIQVANDLRIHISKDKIQLVLKLFQMLQNDDKPTECIDYEAFCRLLQIQYPLPPLKNFATDSNNINHKHTIYRDMCADLLKGNLMSNEVKELSRCEQVKERIKIADHTSAKDVVSPDIPSRFGLTPSDFEILRTKEQLKRIFIHTLCGESFELAWQTALSLLKDESELLSVNELRFAMNVVLNRTDTTNIEQHKRFKHFKKPMSVGTYQPLESRKDINQQNTGNVKFHDRDSKIQKMLAYLDTHKESIRQQKDHKVHTKHHHQKRRESRRESQKDPRNSNKSQTEEVPKDLDVEKSEESILTQPEKKEEDGAEYDGIKNNFYETDRGALVSTIEV